MACARDDLIEVGIDVQDSKFTNLDESHDF